MPTRRKAKRRIIMGEGRMSKGATTYILDTFSGDGPIRVAYVPEDHEMPHRVRLVLEVIK